MKKLITFLLVLFFIETKLLAAPYTINEASGRTQQNFIDDIAVAKTAGHTDLIIQLDNGGIYGASGVGLTITVPTGVTSLKFYAPSGTQPTFYTSGLVTLADAGVMTRITLDGVKFVSVGTSKSLISCSSTVYPLGFTIQNCYVQAFRYVVYGTNSTSCSATITNGITINNNIFNGIYQILAGFAATAIINSQTYSNNTLLDTNTGAVIDYRTALNSGMNFTFSNNTVYSANTTNFGTAGLIRLAANPSSGNYTIINNIIASGSAQTYASGNYRAYANLNFGTSYTTNNITYNATNAYYFTNIQSYTSAIGTLFPNYATYDLTIGDATFVGKSSCGDPRWYYPLTVTPNVTTLSGFSYNEGSGPSASQSFTVSAVALRTAITLTAPADYEISTNNSTFSGSISIGTAGSDLSATLVYVRLKAGLAFAAYNNELITTATTGMSNQTVSCSGNVLSGRTVLGTPVGLSVSGITGSGFTASWNAVANASSYKLNVYQGVSTITTVSGISGTTTDINGLTAGNSYTYKVMAMGDGVSYDNSLESLASASVRLSGSYSTDFFKTKAGGNYSDLSIWQSSPDGSSTWEDATLIPDVNSTSVNVLHNVAYSGSPAIVGNVIINTGVTLTNTATAIAVAAGKTLTIVSGATLDNQMDNATFSAGSGVIQINGTYKVSSYTGTSQLTFSNVIFASGSTLYIGCTGAPRLPASSSGNVVWASAAGGSFLNSNPTTIAGNLTLTNALANALNNGAGNSVRALTIGGDLTINGGVYNPQGGSGTGTQAVAVNGNVYLSGRGKFYAVNPLTTGLGTISINGNIYIQSPIDVVLGAGNTTGILSLAGTSQQAISADASSGYTVDGLTFANSTGVTVTSHLTISNLSNNSGSILNVSPGKQLTVNTSFTNNGTLNLLSDISGTATILTPATIGGTGTASVQQFLTNGRNWYISSPLSIATAPAGYIYYRYDEPGNNAHTPITLPETAYWESISTGVALSPAVGYIAQASAPSTLTFTGGSLNTGDITTGMTSGVPALTCTPEAGQYQGYNLIGNPYPSYLNAMIAVNTAGAAIDPTIWYRTQSNETTPTYYFETVNTTSGIGTDNAGTGTVTGYIPPMQAFWVHATSSPASLTFSNSMRSHSKTAIETGTSATTLLKAPSVQNTVQQILRLQVSNGTNSDEAIVYFNPNASNGLENYDSQKISNNDPAIPEIYTNIGGKKLVINGLNSVILNNDIPLGFTTRQSNSFSIKATEIININSNTKVYLKDNLSSTEIDLTDGTAYSFISDITTTSDRFAIVFKTAGVATNLNSTGGNQAVFVYKNANNQITVNCKGDIIDNTFISIYNILGKKLEHKKITSAITVVGRTFSSGVYLVTVNNCGKTTTQKVILN